MCTYVERTRVPLLVVDVENNYNVGINYLNNTLHTTVPKTISLLKYRMVFPTIKIPTKFVDIHLNQNETSGDDFTAGSSISGSVVILVPDGTEFKSKEKFSLHFNGVEQAYIPYKGGESVSIREKKSEFVSMEIPLDIHNMTGNNVEFPFVFQIPSYCPSSIQIEPKEYENGKYYYGRYKVISKVEYKLTLNDIGYYKETKEKIIKVQQKMSTNVAPVPSLLEPISEDIFSKNIFACCKYKGKIMVAAKVDNTRVAKGDSLKFQIAGVNYSEDDVEDVQVRVIQKFSLGHRHDYTQTVTQTREVSRGRIHLTDTLRVKSKEEIKEWKQDRERMKDWKMQRMKRMGFTENIYKKLLADVQNGKDKYILPIPDESTLKVYDTYEGTYTKVHHLLQIEIVTPEGTTNPKFEVPIHIYSNCPKPSASELHVDNNADEERVEESPSNFPKMNYEYSYQSSPRAYDFANLMDQIKAALNVKSKLQDLLNDSQWHPTVKALTSDEFNLILDEVALDFDKGDVVELLAAKVGNFTCKYASNILYKTIDWMRILVVQKMLPHCIDLKENSSDLLKNLSDWERLSTERDFENAIAK